MKGRRWAGLAVDPVEPPISLPLQGLFFVAMAALALFPILDLREKERFLYEPTWTTADRLYLERLYRYDRRPEVGEKLLRLYLTHNDLPDACQLVKDHPALVGRFSPSEAVGFLRDCSWTSKAPDPFFKERLVEMARRPPSLQLAEALTQVGLFRHALRLYERLLATAPQRQKSELLQRIVQLSLALDEPEQAFTRAEQYFAQIETPTPELSRLMVKVALMAGKPRRAACYAYSLVFYGTLDMEPSCREARSEPFKGLVGCRDGRPPCGGR